MIGTHSELENMKKDRLVYLKDRQVMSTYTISTYDGLARYRALPVEEKERLVRLTLGLPCLHGRKCCDNYSMRQLQAFMHPADHCLEVGEP